MSNIKLIRNRIKSVKSTQKITKAMRMVSAAKLNKAKDASCFARNYRQKILSMLISARNSADTSDLDLLTKSILLNSDKSDRTILIINGSDRGLCGGYNSNIFRKIKREIANYPNVKIITIGKKIDEIVSKICTSSLNILANEEPAQISKKVIEFIESELLNDPSTQVISYYTQFKNTLTQIPSTFRLVPLPSKQEGENASSNPLAQESKVNNLDFANVEFEGENLIKKLTQLYIESNIIANLFESKASEEASRTTAMDNATRNAGQMIQDLTQKMNRTRQTQITKELIEVISGAEAV